MSVTYTNSKLRSLIEEYITQHKNVITLKGVCSYVLYWAVEDNKVVDEESKLFDGNELHLCDQNRIQFILESIVKDGRIAVVHDCDTTYDILTQ